MIVVLGIFLLIGGTGAYLAPDSLRSCDDAPAGTGRCRTADAIITVSGGDTSARTREAVALYQQGWGEKLIFSGAAADKSGPSNASAMRTYAVAAGVPPTDILTEELSETTRENAENTQALLRQNDITDVILVTSAYHQRRAGLEFEARAAGEVSLRNHPVQNDNQWGRFWWLTSEGWYLAATELAKIIAFYFGGVR